MIVQGYLRIVTFFDITEAMEMESCAANARKRHRAHRPSVTALRNIRRRSMHRLLNRWALLHFRLART